jgi:hypothetical protein
LKFSFSKLLFCFSVLVIAVTTLVSCEKLNPEETIPAYIKISEIKLNVPADGSQGSKQSNFNCAWVYIDEELIGVFELPVIFPVLKEGKRKIRIRAGIKQNGISATRVPYPLLTNYESTVQLTPKETIEVFPEVSYFPAVVFHWLENFESPDYTLEKTSSGQVQPGLNESLAEAFEGAKCAKIVLPSNGMRMEIASKQSFNLPKNATPVFLELNFKTNAPITLGVFANIPNNVTQVSSVVLNSTFDDSGNLIWKKIYIEMTPEVSSNKNATDFKLFFGAVKTAENSSSQIEFFLDNIKLMSL